MNKITKILHGLIILAILGGLFYWYGWRPSEIRKNCYHAVLSTSNFDLNYKSCLLDHGLEK